MGDQPVLADIGAHRQPALHHEPAERPLQPAQQEQADQTGPQRRADAVADRAAKTRRGEGNADQPAPQAMDVFPPEDALELVQRHVGLELLEFGDLLVEIELLLPGWPVVERRQHAADGLPLGDGKARFREPGDPADAPP